MINRFLICLLSHLFRIYLSNLISIGRFALFLSVSSAAVLDRPFGSYIGEETQKRVGVGKNRLPIDTALSVQHLTWISLNGNWVCCWFCGERRKVATLQQDASFHGSHCCHCHAFPFPSRTPNFCDFILSYFTDCVVPDLHGSGSHPVSSFISIIGTVTALNL